MLGKLASMGYGPDRIVPIAFHVDYFNDPWKDPLSDPAFSAREAAYNGAQGRKDLYFTPMMMVDGRYPMLGSNRPQAAAAIERALKEPPGVALRLSLEGQPGDSALRKSLGVRVAAISPRVNDRSLLVGVAVFEDPVVTRVPAGENAGKRLVDRFAVRSFAYRQARISADEPPTTLSFPLKLDPGWDAGRCGVAAFVQDWKTGTIEQADSVSWEGSAARPSRARRGD